MGNITVLGRKPLINFKTLTMNIDYDEYTWWVNMSQHVFVQEFEQSINDKNKTT